MCIQFEITNNKATNKSVKEVISCILVLFIIMYDVILIREHSSSLASSVYIIASIIWRYLSSETFTYMS